MAFEHNDGNGSLFKNDKKQQLNQRDWNGSCKINGQDLWISAWIKDGNNGGKFFSLSFEPKQQQAPPLQQYQQPQQQQGNQAPPPQYQPPQYAQPGQPFQQPQQQPVQQQQNNAPVQDNQAPFDIDQDVPF